MEKLIISLTFIAMVLMAGCNSHQPPTGFQAAAPSSSVSQRKPTAQHDHPKVSRVPDYYETKPSLDVLAPTLAPELFTGNQRLAYQAAKEIPQTLAQLPCYCHCDMSIGHKSLQSCFVTEHGENCGICIGEALMAYRLEKLDRLPIAEIRKRIMAAYGTSSGE